MMGIWNRFSGCLEVELTSAGLEEAYGEIVNRRISLYRVIQVDALTVRFVVTKRDYIQIQSLCKQKGWGARICDRRGLYWHLHYLSGRYVLAGALFLCAILTVFLSSVVLIVEVEGNERVPSRWIVEAAGESGIYFGVSKKSIRSEEVKNKLLSQIPELKWVGVNTVGCRTIISVRERVRETDTEQFGVCNIIANKAGIIDTVLVTKGTPMCKPGQAVQEGQILISGYTDCDFTLLSTQAEGEIYANTIHTVSAVTPKLWILRHKINRTQARYSILFGKNRIKLWKGSGICPTTCGRIYKEFYLTLPGNFQLPIALAVEHIINWDTFCADVPGASEMLQKYAGEYLAAQMTAGAVLQRSESIISEEDVLYLIGEYLCREMIGIVQPEWIGENNGENN